MDAGLLLAGEPDVVTDMVGYGYQWGKGSQ
ncbi:hypothetical protein N825_05825 [Skermanella stibiiresistens SB22]|uniref:Uncharacterized protein n=1 Tax=Skermanella stibiiresistens SB22 TaxID=1385369 RepID=W9H0J5_9PROT|nr:hypothetical protein N825_05825 [Skermanella stibiiresistens SB22]